MHDMAVSHEIQIVINIGLELSMPVLTMIAMNLCIKAISMCIWGQVHAPLSHQNFLSELLSELE